MEGNLMETRVCECAEPTPGEVRTEENRKDNEVAYWGVFCKTCRDLVVFDIAPYASFGPAAASMKPGAIRCGQGHNHIYYPRDFGFRGSAVPIAAALMQENRDAYRAVNSPGHRTSHNFVAKADEPPAKPETDDSEPAPPSAEVRSARFGPDPRRAAAQAAAKDRWASWAVSKTTCSS